MNERQQMHKTSHRVATKEKDEIKTMTKQKIANHTAKKEGTT